jgi:hypothetical protein
MLVVRLLPQQYTITLYICFVGSRPPKGGDTMWDRSDNITYFPSNPGRLVEVLLGALVGYRRDGKAFDARYDEAYYYSALIQRFFRQVCEKEMRRIDQENESIYSKGKAHPTRDEKRNIHD